MTTLDNIMPGETCTVVGFSGGDEDYIRKLLFMGITKGANIKVVRYAPLGDPMEIKVRDFHMSIRKKESSVIQVVKDVQS